MCGDDVEIVFDLCVGKAAKQRLCSEATGGAAQYCEGHAGVVDAAAEDLAGEQVAILFRNVHEGERLLVSDVVVGCGVVLKTREVHHVAEDVPEPKRAGGVRFHGQDCWQVVGHADRGADDRCGECCDPPLEVQASAQVQQQVPRSAALSAHK